MLREGWKEEYRKKKQTGKEGEKQGGREGNRQERGGNSREFSSEESLCFIVVKTGFCYDLYWAEPRTQVSGGTKGKTNYTLGTSFQHIWE